jgi:hypothetical protein
MIQMGVCLMDDQQPLVRLKAHLRGIDVIINVNGSHRVGSISAYKMPHLIQLLNRLGKPKTEVEYGSNHEFR